MEEELETVEEISSKTWNTMRNNLSKEGFREGAGAGKKSVFQSNFDAGYREGFKIGFAKGFLSGFLSILKDRNNGNININGAEVKLPSTPCILCEDDVRQKLETSSIKEMANFLIKDNELLMDSMKTSHVEIFKVLGIDSKDMPCFK